MLKILFKTILILAPLQSIALGVEKAPTTDLEATLNIVAKIKLAYPDSIFAETQIELWLDKLTTEELLAMEKSIPTAWSTHRLGFLSDRTNLDKHLQNLTDKTIELGRVAGNKNWQNAISTAASYRDINTKRLYLLGVLISAGRHESFHQAEALREKILPQLSRDQQHTISCYRSHHWLPLWPADSIAAHGKALDEDKKFSLIRRVSESANMFFSDYQDGEKFLQHFGSSAPGQAPVIGESMGRVLAARNPKQFIKWFQQQDENMQSFVIPDAIEPLLRNDPNLIQEIIPFFKNSRSYTSMEIAKEWARHEPIKAKKWAATMPIHDRFGKEFIFDRSSTTLPDFKTFKQTSLLEHQLLPRPSSKQKQHLTLAQLTDLANPGASPIANTSLYEQVFSIGPHDTKEIFFSLVKSQPKNANEMLVRKYLLESWILYEPEIACDWILASGDGRMRTLLPLAFVHMEKQDLSLLKKRLNKIPETDIYHRCLAAIQMK